MERLFGRPLLGRPQDGTAEQLGDDPNISFRTETAGVSDALPVF